MTLRPSLPTCPIRFVRWAAAVGVVVLLGWAPPVSAGPDSTTTSSAGAPGPVECLDQRLHPADTCPAVELSVAIEAKGDDLVVRVTNDGGRTWKGGPLAVELPVPGARVDEPEGRVDDSGRPGQPEWTTRAGTVVSRCVFEPVAELRAGADLTCRLRRLGLADGEHVLWFTGFVGGLPRVAGKLGDATPTVGVVGAAATRSVRIAVDGTHVEVLAPNAPAGTQAGAGDDGRRGGRGPSPFVISGLLATAGVGVLLRRSRRSA